MTVDIALPIATLIAGALLGFVTNIYLQRLEAKQRVLDKVIEQYFAARDKLCVELSKLATLQASMTLDKSEISLIKNRISELYFQNYDFFPTIVLQELNCLFVCLSDANNRVFRCKAGRVTPLDVSEISTFVESITLVENFRYSALLYLQSKDDNLRRSASINYQARSVLVSLNKHFTLQHLMSWMKHIAKK